MGCCAVKNTCCFCIPANAGLLVAAIFGILWCVSSAVFWDIHFAPHGGHEAIIDTIDRDIFPKADVAYWVSSMAPILPLIGGLTASVFFIATFVIVCKDSSKTKTKNLMTKGSAGIGFVATICYAIAFVLCLVALLSLLNIKDDIGNIQDEAEKAYLNKDFLNYSMNDINNIQSIGNQPLYMLIKGPEPDSEWTGSDDSARGRILKLTREDGWAWINDKVFNRPVQTSHGYLKADWWTRTMKYILEPETGKKVTLLNPNREDDQGNSQNIVYEMVLWAGDRCIHHLDGMSDDVSNIPRAMECAFKYAVDDGLKEGLIDRLLFHKIADATLMLLSFIWMFIFLAASLAALFMKHPSKDLPLTADEGQPLNPNQNVNAPHQQWQHTNGHPVASSQDNPPQLVPITGTIPQQEQPVVSHNPTTQPKQFDRNYTMVEPSAPSKEDVVTPSATDESTSDQLKKMQEDEIAITKEHDKFLQENL